MPGQQALLLIFLFFSSSETPINLSIFCTYDIDQLLEVTLDRRPGEICVQSNANRTDLRSGVACN
jgi:hypothetical protein